MTDDRGDKSETLGESVKRGVAAIEATIAEARPGLWDDAAGALARPEGTGMARRPEVIPDPYVAATDLVKKPKRDEYKTYTAKAHALVVDSPDALEACDSLQRMLGVARQEVHVAYDMRTKRLYTEWNASTAARKALLDDLDRAWNALGEKRGIYSLQTEDEGITATLECQADDRADAEQERQEQIDAAHRASNHDLAETLRAAPIRAARPMVQPEAAGPAGKTLTANRFTWELTDAGALPDEFKVPDKPKIQKVVKAMGLGAADTIGTWEGDPGPAWRPAITVTEHRKITPK